MSAVAHLTRATRAQQQACAWLAAHNGSGAWDKHNVLIAAGERAPIRRSTWNSLRDLGAVAFAKGTRVELTADGRYLAAQKPFDASKHSIWTDYDDDGDDYT